MIEMKKDIFSLIAMSIISLLCSWLFQVAFFLRPIMINGEHNDGQVSDTYLDNIIKQLEISDGSQQTSCVR